MRRTAALAAMLFGSLVVRAEIVDRIAASIGTQVITDSAVVEELRATAFVEGVPVDLSADARRKALERLIDQSLIRREVNSTRFPLPSEDEVAPLYKQVRDRFPTEAAYKSELDSYGITDADVRAHLQWQLMMLRFIEYRFQPGVQVSEADIAHEYEGFERNWREQKHTEPPPLADVHAEMEKVARQMLIDSALDRWLGEVRTQNEILYHKGYEP